MSEVKVKPPRYIRKTNNPNLKGRRKSGKKLLIEEVAESTIKMQEAKPSILPEVEAEILKYISMGLTIGDACSLTKINRDTFLDWKTKGKQDEADGKSTMYVTFLGKLKQAELTAKAFHLQNINKHAKGGYKLIKHRIRKDRDGNIIDEETYSDEVRGSWQASSWFLSRVFPEEYGNNREAQNNNDNKPLPFMGADEANDIPDPLADSGV